MKRTMMFLLSATLLFALFTPGYSENNSLTIWLGKTFDENSNRILKERVEQFGKENNVDIVIEFVAQKDQFQKWSAAIESGQTPDISHFPYNVVAQFYERGILRDVSGLMKKIEQKNGSILPDLKKVVSFKDKQFALPITAHPWLLFYRKDLLSAAGYSEPPKTWEEYQRIAKATTNSAKGIYGSGIGMGKNCSDFEWVARSIIWSYGGSEVGKDGKTITINSPNTLKAVKLIADMFLIDRSTPPSAVNWDDSGNNKAYLSGQVAMVINNGTLLSDIEDTNPELAKNTGIAVLPAGPKGRFNIGNLATYGIFKNSKNPELSEKLLEYIFNKEWYGKWIGQTAPFNCPVYVSMKNDDVWKKPVNKVFIDTLQDFVFIGYPGELSSKIAEIFNMRYLNDTFQQIVIDKKTPEIAIADLENRIQNLFNKK